jgi:hypothetical protein
VSLGNALWGTIQPRFAVLYVTHRRRVRRLLRGLAVLEWDYRAGLCVLGADGVTRTRDLPITNRLLYQLSYISDRAKL